MAEFALGLTKTAVEGTLSKVKSAIDEEAQLKERVQNDLVFITGEFQMMQSFLNVANTERAKNKVVQTWVRQLRDLAFDVEDCVDFVVHLDNKSALSWLWRRVVPSCMAPPLPMDVAVAEIKQLKARVEDVSQRNTRYNLISDSGSSSSSSSKPLFSPSPVEQPVTASISPSDILNELWGAAGKKRGTDDLKRLISSEGSDLEVISVWGSTGAADIGATRIIREAYNDPEICQEFKIRAWVKLMHPFNPEEFLKSLLTQFYKSSHQANVGVDFRKTMKAVVNMEDELTQQVSKQRYLVILEELSTLVEWDAIRMYLPLGRNGSRIVVSTKQLRLALCCTGEPYQLSDLSDDQSLFAFFNKVPGRRSDMSELSWQLRCRGVISIWGPDDGKSTLLHKVYTCIMHKSKEFEGVEFEQHNWVDAPDPFDLNVFAQRLFLNFHLVDLRAEKIAAVLGRKGEAGVIEACCRFLRENDCLIIIYDLESTDDWDLIKETFLSEPTKGSIIVRTYHEYVATYCAVEEDRTFNIHDLEKDALLRHSIKGCEYYGFRRQQEGRFFSNRMEEARHWTHRFGLSVKSRLSRECLRSRLHSVAGVTSLWGPAGKSGLVRRIYYEYMLRREDVRYYLRFGAFSWVDVSHPFNLVDFSWSLFLDFHSDDPEAKEAAAVGLMKGQDPIDGCRRKFLREQTCFIVINGIRSTDDWDLIEEAFSFDYHYTHDGSRIVVITNEESVAKYCMYPWARKEISLCGNRAFDIKGLATLPPLIKEVYRDDSDEEDGSLRARVFSDRMEEARDWMDKIEPTVHFDEWVGLSERLLRRDYPGVISVWGIAGVGKSALVKTIYYNRMLGLRHARPTTSGTDRECSYPFSEEFTAFSWVDVPHPFNLTEFSWRLLLDFLSDDPQAKENATLGMMEGQDPIQVCRKFLHQQKCFVVIDALHSTDDWDSIKDAFLSKPIKGCIVVITYEASVATHCAHDNKNKKSVFNVKGLEADVALRLFEKIHNRGSKPLTPKTTKLAKLIMAKCGGLSKVIAAIGEQCAKLVRADAWQLDFNTADEDLLKSIINGDFMGVLESDPGFHSLRGLFSWMQSYFDACSDSLKPCIFYLSVFPADHKVRRKRLLRRWIAEGYSRDKIGSTAEEDGEMLFSELVKLSIIQESPSKSREHIYRDIDQQPPSKVKVCQVNAFFHGYIMSRPMEDNLVFALVGHCSPNSQHTGQHLTVWRSWDRDKIVFESIDVTRLRSLTVFGKWKSFFVSDSMRLLRVLDLENTSGVTDDDLEQIGKLLGRLKFLSLRGCEEITRLPNSVCGMRQLQTLDVKGTSIVTLPANITKLHKLQYIRAGTIVAAPDDLPTSSTPPEADGDGTADTSVAATDDSSSSTSSTPPEADDDGTADANAAAAHDPSTSSTPPEAGGDGMADTSVAAADDPSTSSTPPEAGGDGTADTSVATADDPLTSSTLPEASGDGKADTSVATADDLPTSSTPPEADGDGTVGTSVAAADDLPRSGTPPEADGDGTVNTSVAAADDLPTSSTLPEAEGDGTVPPATWSSRARDLVSSCWLSNIKLRRRRLLEEHCGVEVPAGIGKLTALRTLGVINVSGAGGKKAILRELTKLSQLRKLRVCGINRENWQDLCGAISGHAHLESLSVRLDEGVFACFDDISHPPNTLESLKLYGNARVSLHWIMQLPNLRKGDFELTISTQEDIDSLKKLPHRGVFRRLCVKPTEDRQLHFGWSSCYGGQEFTFPVLKIDCSDVSRLEIVFGLFISEYVELLVVHCSSESSLELSGLRWLRHLKKVSLKGSYGDAVKQHLKQKVSEHENKPVLKLEE